MTLFVSVDYTRDTNSQTERRMYRLDLKVHKERRDRDSNYRDLPTRKPVRTSYQLLYNAFIDRSPFVQDYYPSWLITILSYEQRNKNTLGLSISGEFSIELLSVHHGDPDKGLRSDLTSTPRSGGTATPISGLVYFLSAAPPHSNMSIFN